MKFSFVFNALESVVKNFPGIKEIISERDTLRRSFGFVPPGHFYSPIPSLDDIQRDDQKIFGDVPSNILGLDLHEEEQLQLLNEFIVYYDEMPFQPKKHEGLRYYYENPAYS